MNPEKVRELFESYDFNKNGVLEKEEFVQIFTKLLRDLGQNMPERRHEEVAEEAIQRFDMNENGKIEFDEFCNVMRFFVEEKGYNL